eukprot:3849323-Amphidinium_carterae.1
MLDSGAGASVCSPNDFPTITIDTQSEVTKVHRCADGRELKAYGYKWVKALVSKTQQILQIRFTVLHVYPHHRALMPSTRWLGLKLWWSTSGSDSNAQRNTEKAWVDTTDSFEEEVADDAARQEHAFHEGEEQDQQEAGEMK